MRFWKYICGYYLFRWMFGSRESRQSDHTVYDRSVFDEPDESSCGGFWNPRANIANGCSSPRSHSNYSSYADHQSYDEFLDEQDEFDNFHDDTNILDDYDMNDYYDRNNYDNDSYYDRTDNEY